MGVWLGDDGMWLGMIGVVGDDGGVVGGMMGVWLGDDGVWLRMIGCGWKKMGVWLGMMGVWLADLNALFLEWSNRSSSCTGHDHLDSHANTSLVVTPTDHTHTHPSC